MATKKRKRFEAIMPPKSNGYCNVIDHDLDGIDKEMNDICTCYCDKAVLHAQMIAKALNKYVK